MTNMPTFTVEDRTFSRLILGHNPLLGYSYLSEARAKEYVERFSRYEPIRDVVCTAVKLGVRSMMLSTGHAHCGNIARAIEEAQERTGVQMSNLVIIDPSFEEGIDFLRRVQCQVCLVHGQRTDSYFMRAQRSFQPEFSELLTTIRKCGFVPGMSTHNGGETIPTAEPFDVAVVNTPINKIAWRMCPCEEQVLQVVRGFSRKIIAMKPLAMGRIPPRDGMDYIASVAGVDGVVVGIATAAEAEETIGLALQAFSR
jgi:hypothetical protein